MIWFTADTHFGHENIIKYCYRPFNSVNEMDQALIDNWNERVAPEDTVYHLGDFTLGGYDRFVHYVNQLNGYIIFVPGGHDWRWAETSKNKILPYSGSNKLVQIEPPLITDKIHKQLIVLCHYALRVWDRSHYGSWQLYGHSHGNLPPLPNSLDVGVDVWGYAPISFGDVERNIGC